jgi:hypothetical protein
MTHGNLSQYSGFNAIPPSRAIFALSQGRDRAKARGADKIVDAIDKAIAANQEARDAEGEWRHARQVDDMSRREAAEIDHDLDRAVGALYRQLRDIKSLFDDEPKGETAARILEKLFPEGAAAITRMSFEPELGAVNYILDSLEEDWGNDLDDLDITSTVQRLDTLADQFEDALAKPDRAETTWDEVREARKRGQDAMLHAVATVIAEYGTNEDADIEARREILSPLLEQDERVSQLHAENRTVTGVDPESGEEQPPEDGPQGPGDGDSPGDGEPTNDGGSQTGDQSETDDESQPEA